MTEHKAIIFSIVSEVVDYNTLEELEQAKEKFQDLPIGEMTDKVNVSLIPYGFVFK